MRIIVCVFLLACIAAVFFIFHAKNDAPANKTQTAAAKAEPDYSPELATIQAKSFYVYDLNEKKVLFAKNEHEELPLASVTKLMSGLIVMLNLPPSATVTITPEDVSQDGGSDNGLFVGEKWDAHDLLNFSLIMSSNEGMFALARTLDAERGPESSSTVDLMNSEAQKLGLADTFFFNVSGLDLSATTSGAYSSAYDVTELLQKILTTYPALISKTTETAADFISESNIRHIAINTDTLINDIPGLIASKTGFTDLAGGNLVIAFDAGLAHPVVIAVLGSTEDGRFTDVEELMHLTLEKLSE